MLVCCSFDTNDELGSDIDIRVLRGIIKGKQTKNLYVNFDQYHLRYPDIIRMDINRLPIKFTSLYMVL